MSAKQIDFQALDLRNATENEYICLSKFKNNLNREYDPDDPPTPLEEHIQGWKNLPEFVEYEAYATWDLSNSTIIAYCAIYFSKTGDNEHIAEFRIEVLPEYRNHGIGRQALKLLLPFAKAHQRTLLMSSTSDRIPESEILFKHLGARKGLEMRISQLKLAEFDRTLVDPWLMQTTKKQLEFEVGFLDGAYPDQNIVEIAALRQAVGNDQPRDDLEMEDMKITPDLLRQMEQNLFATGNQRWTIYLTDRIKGKIAGITEVFWNPNRGAILDQGFTGIYPTYRNKGLGRWLKAEMLNKVLAEHPEVEFVRTGNANSNTPMLKINLEIGFKPYKTNTIWQVKTEQVEKYLSGGDT